MEFFAKIVDSFQSLTIFAKGSIIDVWMGSQDTSGKVSKTVFPEACIISWQVEYIISWQVFQHVCNLDNNTRIIRNISLKLELGDNVFTILFESLFLNLSRSKILFL